MSAKVAIGVFLLLAALHQDNWLWNDRTLWLGFLPAGLGYHALYSVVAALFWAGVNRYAWPHRLEAWAEGGESN